MLIFTSVFAAYIYHYILIHENKLKNLVFSFNLKLLLLFNVLHVP